MGLAPLWNTSCSFIQHGIRAKPRLSSPRAATPRVAHRRRRCRCSGRPAFFFLLLEPVAELLLPRRRRSGLSRSPWPLPVAAAAAAPVPVRSRRARRPWSPPHLRPGLLSSGPACCRRRTCGPTCCRRRTSGRRPWLACHSGRRPWLARHSGCRTSGRRPWSPSCGRCLRLSRPVRAGEKIQILSPLTSFIQKKKKNQRVRDVLCGLCCCSSVLCAL